jgi:hypothetical protein
MAIHMFHGTPPQGLGKSNPSFFSYGDARMAPPVGRMTLASKIEESALFSLLALKFQQMGKLSWNSLE